MVKSACGIEAVYMCFNGTGIWGGETICRDIWKKKIMAAFLKIQDGRHIYIWQIGNIGFLIAYTTQFPKMYRLASLPKMPTKLHTELD